ncbi:MAG: hypothetical protein DK304_001153 [Chloroflexi bacterium]|nr:MAG: hypothetical protein DK304_001153 [Chloroflexota bacterium]
MLIIEYLSRKLVIIKDMLKLILFASLLIAVASGCTGSSTESPAISEVSSNSEPYLDISSADARGFGGDSYSNSYGSSSQSTGIFVNGSGKISVKPDLGIINLGVSKTDKTVSRARKAAGTAMNAVMNAVKKSGVADNDIKTQHFGIQPEYRWTQNKQEFLGYKVTNNISVKVRNLDNVGDLIDEVANAGGDLIRLTGISFTVEDANQLAVKARELAVQDAITKAKQFASLTDVTLGKLIYISETGSNTPIPMVKAAGIAFSEAADISSSPISEGEVEIVIRIQAVFGIV